MGSMACDPGFREYTQPRPRLPGLLIRQAGRVIGQIDADADEIGAFDATDESLLTAVAERLAGLVPTS